MTTLSLQCRLCGSHQVIPLFTERRAGRDYTSYRCTSCGLQQTLGDIDSVSPDYVELEAKDMSAAHRFLQSEHKRAAFDQWRRLVRRALDKPVGQATLLDIGCGVGGFLDYARAAGASTYGFDASAAHVADAASRHPNVRRAFSISDYWRALEQQPLCDLVTMWDVFEHIRQPEHLLSEISDILARSKGLLYLSVPSGAMNPIKVRIANARARPAGLIPWEHVFYYTPASLRLLLEKAGFEVLSIGGVAPYVRVPMTAHEFVRRVAHRLLAPTRFALQIHALARLPHSH